MVNDPGQNDPGGGPRRQRPDSGGRQNPLVYLLPNLLRALFKYPKFAIPALLIGGAFLYFKGGCKGLIPSSGDPDASVFATGAEMKQEVYDKAEVFENLYPDNTKNPLPEEVSLLQYCPTRKNQGQQGSCVAWSSAYAARTILEARATGQDPDAVKFSPSYLYNQIKLEGCQGAYLQNAMETMKKNGGLPFDAFPYTDQSCNKKPTAYELKKAQEYNIRGAQRLSLDGENYKVNMLAIKQNLAQGSPVVIGMRVGGTFMQEMTGKAVWIPEEQDYNMNGFGGHAMCVIGYDDHREGGAFQIMNSWGREWGNDGIAWVRYNDFDYFVVEAFGLYPMGNARQETDTKFKISFGLAEMNDQNLIAGYIPIQQVRNNLFRTEQKLLKNETRFKLEVTNTLECYTYVLGEETDGSSYVLFPYTPKHSPFCGITGTRLFPKNQSLQPDETGNKDRFAILVSKKPVDYKELNKKINRSKKTDFGSRISEALGEKHIKNVSFTAGKTFGFETGSFEQAHVVFMVIEVNK